MFYSRHVKHVCCFLLVCKQTQISSFPFNFDLCMPLATSLMAANTVVWRCCICSLVFCSDCSPRMWPTGDSPSDCCLCSRLYGLCIFSHVDCLSILVLIAYGCKRRFAARFYGSRLAYIQSHYHIPSISFLFLHS